MVQATENGGCDDPTCPFGLGLAVYRAVFPKTQMSSRAIVVAHKLAKLLPQMLLVQHDDMVEALPAKSPYPPFRDGILPGRAWGGDDGLDTYAFEGGLAGHEERITIVQQEARSRVPGKSLANLLNNPGCSGIGGYVEMDDATAFMVDQDQDVEYPEEDGRHGEEVHRHDLTGMIFQEGLPGR